MALRLHAVATGDGPPVAILHGLFGSGRNWATIARHLAARFRVIAIDLRNHGASPWADEMDYRGMAEDVLLTLRGLGHPHCALIGHSMGGKAAMLAALTAAAAVDRLVVADIAPVAYPSHHAALVAAMRRLDVTGIRRRAEADARLAAAVADPAERAFLLQNLVFDGGEPRWRINLAAIEAAMPELAGFPALPAGTAYRGPALFVAGARSDYVRPEHEAAIRHLFPAARIARLADTGHWLHAEQPQAFLAAIEPFLLAGR